MALTLSAFADEAADRVDQQIEALQKAGIDHIDPRNVGGTSITELPPEQAVEVKKQLNAAGIRVNMFGSPIGKLDIADDFEIDLKRLRHLGELRPVLDCTRVRMFSYYNKNGADTAVWRETCLERMKRLCEVAGECGLALYHENERHIFGDRLTEVCVLRDEVHRRFPEQFKLIFDFDNFNQSGDDVWANWIELRDATEAIHLKDSKKQADGSCQHMPAGQGDGQIPKILADASQRGWQGPLTLEPHLSHSKAVLATGASGSGNQSLADMPREQTFQIAADAAIEILKDVGQR